MTPIYKALHQFAKEFPAGSEVVRCEYNSKDFVAIAKKEKNGYRVVVANLTNKSQKITIKCGDKSKIIKLTEFDIIDL